MSSRASDLLEEAYRSLDFVGGQLVATAESPSDSDGDWSATGDWLILAARMGAERLFFVNDDPVVVFARLPGPPDEARILGAYRRAWSMSRPRCLFLATDDDLRVYALTQPPPRASRDEGGDLRPLQIVQRVVDVRGALSAYTRDCFESGSFLEDDNFAARAGRADERLLRDLRVATARLVDDGLDPRTSHLLIERVILARYLEDRGVINGEYLRVVASRKPGWIKKLDRDDPEGLVGPRSTFVNCLTSKTFAYAVFDQLATDFNGDLFLASKEEKKRVTQRHLTLVRSLLLGVGGGDQQELFLWAYDFGVIPTNLISSMYEQFYRSSVEDGGTHYTPPELVEYILSTSLTSEVLSRSPSICDPACGSGIFLVEAFRRIVRFEMERTGQRLPRQRLEQILLTRLAGIDVNEEAVRLAAFSLYLAFLNYQSPPDIAVAGPLPRLISSSVRTSVAPVLFVGDAFDPLLDEEPSDGDVAKQLPWRQRAFDLVVGNPPWDEPGGVRNAADAWVASNGYAVGDRNPSQQFLWRALSLLSDAGSAALLVAATPFHNRRSASFRAQWLSQVQVEHVVNFTSARNLFFAGAIAPFMLVCFRRGRAPSSSPVSYQTIQPTRSLAGSRSMAFATSDRRWVEQLSLESRDYLWKLYAWGGHRDEALMARLDAEVRLRDVLPQDPEPGYGYQLDQNEKEKPSQRLRRLRSLRRMDIWGPLEKSWFEAPPRFVKRQPDERRYDGQRIIISEGVNAGFGPRARLERTPFSFRHIFYCLPLAEFPQWKAKLILGTILSRLGRYRMFMTSGSWGVWHDKFNSDDFLELPVRMPNHRDESAVAIARAVDDLARATPSGVLADRSSPLVLEDVLARLDSSVADLFELSPAERDLVDDFHRYTLPLVGRRSAWRVQAQVPYVNGVGTAADLDRAPAELAPYLRTFLSAWNRELGATGQLTWRVVSARHAPLVGAVFEARAVDEPALADGEDADWSDALDALALVQPTLSTPEILSLGTVRAISPTTIVVIKHSAARLWSSSAARDDVDATMLQAMTALR